MLIIIQNLLAIVACTGLAAVLVAAIAGATTEEGPMILTHQPQDRTNAIGDVWPMLKGNCYIAELPEGIDIITAEDNPKPELWANDDMTVAEWDARVREYGDPWGFLNH